MTSKWIEDIFKLQYMGLIEFDDIELILNRIDKLLRLASYCVESDKQLYEDIRKEIHGNW